MNYPLPGVIVEPEGVSTSVAITDSHGNTPTVYADAFGLSTVSMPDTITARKKYYLPGEGPWTVTPTANGEVTSATTLTLEGSQVATITVGSAFSPAQWSQLDAYVTDQYGATGAPTTGTWLTGQSIIDSAGTVWNCTTGGTPGTWAQKGAAAPLTLTAGTATTVPLTLVGAASQTADLLHIENSAGTVIVSINNSGNLIVGSLNVGYANGISSTAGAINGYFVPGVNRANSGYFQGSYYGGLGLSIPGSGTIGTVLTSGSGAPTIGGALGDIYFRTDTPATANQRVYICTTAGVAGAAVWTGIL